ncbi:hypothetical protein [Saccharothrix syringae]|uniref:XRE family transcriptional regulator n=1 Tax=Saccharothrix syringae TaxID=103733 RepID=A0A5Q0GU14_SACSY|nr:hypothetical protein [Saccharothrix syringae]QFZ17413.1 hypothetical protein EKG83_07930 [Saccharothrix syringae]
MPGPVGGGFVAHLRDRIGALVHLDQRHGGLVAAPVALRAYREARDRLRAGGVRRGHGRDACSALAELGEVAGWSLSDAAAPRLAERVNREALGYARLAGDRGVELFLRQNTAMLAEWTGRPRESADLVGAVLETRLSPRLEALFRLRLAHASAQLGLDGQARRQLARARGLYEDGVRDDDPPWSWWINEAQLNWFEGAVHLRLGRAASVEAFERAAEAVSEPRMDRNCRLWALYAHAVNRSWGDVDRLARDLLPAGGIRSGLARARLDAALGALDRGRAPGTVRELVSALRARAQ